MIQFFMKLEKKMHAKEAEMNQIQAKTQEKTEAEIRQFRRSLNFKATPMPSSIMILYHQHQMETMCVKNSTTQPFYTCITWLKYTAL
ncbi:Protein WVD2-like 7 [Vitis vinifera]|uniref:Protein WVD2-like 7 n=1 Tax=Vitis vinifera TaxID=29760 RepID=A0A438C157_VITVI|nr:Protein WVD2-like 7 [Vitis vinifera]